MGWELGYHRLLSVGIVQMVERCSFWSCITDKIKLIWSGKRKLATHTARTVFVKNCQKTNVLSVKSIKVLTSLGVRTVIFVRLFKFLTQQEHPQELRHQKVF